MAELFVAFDENKPPGQRLAPEVREEISEVAPSTLNDRAVTEPKLDDRAVSNRALALGAVHAENIGAAEVTTDNLDTKAVTRAKIADDAVGPDQVGTGVVTAHDADGNPVASDMRKMTLAQYEAIPGGPNPNTTYLIIST